MRKLKILAAITIEKFLIVVRSRFVLLLIFFSSLRYSILNMHKPSLTKATELGVFFLLIADLLTL